MSDLANLDLRLSRWNGPVTAEALLPNRGKGLADWQSITVRELVLIPPKTEESEKRPSLFLLLGGKKDKQNVRARSIAAVRLPGHDTPLSGLDFVGKITGIPVDDIQGLTDWSGESSLRIAPTIQWGEDGLLKEWAFGVARAFEPSLDLRWEDIFIRKIPHRIYTEGFPRLVRFRAGDFLHSPARYSCDLRPWGEVRHDLNSSVQVLDATDDCLDDRLPFTIKDGTVRFLWIKYKSGQRVSATEHVLTQQKFYLFLKTGEFSSLEGDVKPSPVVPSQGVFSGF